MVHDLREDERELAGAILEGSKRRTDQAFGRLLPRGRNSSCALGAAYEGIYRLPDTVDGVRPQRLDRLFECLEGVVRTCPECSTQKLPLGALIVHVNDAHHWTREPVAAGAPTCRKTNHTPITDGSLPLTAIPRAARRTSRSVSRGARAAMPPSVPPPSAAA